MIFASTHSGIETDTVYNKTQFEIERRSCGQSITYLGSLVVKVKKKIIGVNYFFCMCLVRNLQKKMEKNVQNKSSCGSALGTALTD